MIQTAARPGGGILYLPAQTTVDEKTFARIRSEEAGHSRIMQALRMLTDR